MKDFAGKTAFITGGASGLGLGIAKACAVRGMNVVIADLRQSALDAAKQVFDENNWKALFLILNISDRDGFAKAADAAEAEFGKIHLLVNNAGIACTGGPFWEVTYEETDFAIDVNLKGILNGIHEIVPRMLKHGEESHIVSTASMAGIIPNQNFGLYNITKAGVVSIMETLAEDFGETNIGSSVFCPGPHNTTLGKSSSEVTGTLMRGEDPVTDEEDKPSSFDTSLTKAPDEAGERVLRGISRGDLYIFTHSEFKKGFEEKADTILKSFPDEVPDERVCEAFSFLVAHPIFGKQTQVPAYKKD